MLQFLNISVIQYMYVLYLTVTLLSSKLQSCNVTLNQCLLNDSSEGSVFTTITLHNAINQLSTKSIIQGTHSTYMLRRYSQFLMSDMNTANPRIPSPLTAGILPRLAQDYL